MNIWDVFFVLVVGIAAGLIPIVLLMVPRAKRSLASQYESKYKAEIESLKAGYESQLRAKQLEYQASKQAPAIPDISSKYASKDARYTGGPVDFVVFKNFEAKEPLELVFLSVKKGNAELTDAEKAVKEAIDNRRVRFETVKAGSADEPIPSRRVVTKRYSSDGKSVSR